MKLLNLLTLLNLLKLLKMVKFAENCRARFAQNSLNLLKIALSWFGWFGRFRWLGWLFFLGEVGEVGVVGVDIFVSYTFVSYTRFSKKLMKWRRVSYRILQWYKVSYLQWHKVSYYFSVTESVILMTFGELSYFGNFFDFGNVFGDIHLLVLAQKWRESWGRSRASWRPLEAPYTPEKIKLTKIIYGLPFLLPKKFCATHPTSGSLSKIK